MFDIVVEAVPAVPEVVAESFSPSLIITFVSFATLQAESALYYGVLFEVGLGVFAIVSAWEELPWNFFW